MADTTLVLKSEPGIKRDGTKYDGNFYVDGLWARWQRGLPRKIGGYRVSQRYLPEVSRGFTMFTQQLYLYCHSGGASKLQRFTIDEAFNGSAVYDRTAVAVKSTGTVTLLTGASGSVTSVRVDDVELMAAPVSFTTDLPTTATAVAASITANVSSPDYTAVAAGAVVTISASVPGMLPNSLVVAATATTITVSTEDMSGGSDALASDANNMWMFDYQFDASSSDNYVLAHVSPNMSYPANASGGQIFYGKLTDTTPLKSVNIPYGVNCTGGIVALHPYLFYYGTDGVIGWSIPGDPTDLSGTGSGIARAWGQKIVKGMPLRAGSGSAPAGIFWAYDAVIRAVFVGGDSVFQFDVIASDTSIMSAASVVDYDGIFFWAGTDRFLMFNGVVREVQNQLNINWFFDNINRSKRGKVFAFKNTRYGEIWWCYPRGTSEECTHAVIYNVRENTWYDTELPNSGRSCGTFNNATASPVLAGVDAEDGTYKIWVHEQGMDEIDGQRLRPIRSYFETADLSSLVQGRNEAVRVTRIEPDFVQTGDMTVQVTGRANARAKEVYSAYFRFPDTASEPYEEIVVMKEQRREIRLRFESNCINGDYQMGQIIGHVSPGDKTIL
jgi:hypothetical protein